MDTIDIKNRNAIKIVKYIGPIFGDCVIPWFLKLHVKISGDCQGQYSLSNSYDFEKKYPHMIRNLYIVLGLTNPESFVLYYILGTVFSNCIWPPHGHWHRRTRLGISALDIV
jgi:hypothetical protein